MKKIVLLPCSKRKSKEGCKAIDMYKGTLFKKYLEYIKDNVDYDQLYILSAKYGLLCPGSLIQPYEMRLTLKKEQEEYREKWYKDVINQLSVGNGLDLDDCEFIIFASKPYYKGLLKYFKHYTIPFEGLGMLQQLSLMKKIRKEKNNESK